MTVIKYILGKFLSTPRLVNNLTSLYVGTNKEPANGIIPAMALAVQGKRHQKTIPENIVAFFVIALGVSLFVLINQATFRKIYASFNVFTMKNSTNDSLLNQSLSLNATVPFLGQFISANKFDRKVGFESITTPNIFNVYSKSSGSADNNQKNNKLTTLPKRSVVDPRQRINNRLLITNPMPFHIVAVEWKTAQVRVSVLLKQTYYFMYPGQTLAGWTLLTVTKNKLTFESSTKAKKRINY